MRAVRKDASLPEQVIVSVPYCIFIETISISAKDRHSFPSALHIGKELLTLYIDRKCLESASIITLVISSYPKDILIYTHIPFS